MYKLRRLRYVVRNGLFLEESLAQLRNKLRKRPHPLLPQVSLEDVAGSGSPHALLEPDAVEGNVTVEELEALAAITRRHRPQRIFEIGTFDGRTTINLAASAPDAEVFTLDLPPDRVCETRLRVKTGDYRFADKPGSLRRFLGTPFEARITQLYDDSATFDAGPFENSMDMVFVDGAHSYEYVRNDTELARRLLRPGGGTILWHDYCFNEVIRGLNEFYTGDPWFRGMVSIRNTTLAYLCSE